jgi:hypothetical protein
MLMDETIKNSDMANNDNLTNRLDTVKSMDNDSVDFILNKYPKSKQIFAALLLLVEAEKNYGVDVSDWECDLADIVWKEISEK